MRVSTSQLFQQRVTALLAQQEQLGKTEIQLATGKRVMTAADDPLAAVRNLQLGDQLARLDQYQKNVDTASSRLDQEEGVLASSADLLQRVRELAVNGLNATNGPAELKSLAFEVREHLDQLLNLANTRDANGEYLFSGYQGDTEAYTADGVGNFSYNGDQGQRHLQISSSRQIAVADHGVRVFEGIATAAGGVASTFDILYNFAESLNAGSPDPDILTDIDAALNRTFDVRAEVGSRLRSLEDQRNTNSAVALHFEGERSDIMDLDYAEAISRFNQQLLAFETSQQVFSKVQGLSLFDYLG